MTRYCEGLRRGREVQLGKGGASEVNLIHKGVLTWVLKSLVTSVLTIPGLFALNKANVQ